MIQLTHCPAKGNLITSVHVNHGRFIYRRPKTRDSTFTTNNGRLLSYFSSLDGQLCPVVLWDASVHPEGNSVLKLTWGEYQNALKQRCLMPKSFSPKPDSICSTVHHHEWSKLALFDFLLQVIKRGLYLQYVIV